MHNMKKKQYEITVIFEADDLPDGATHDTISRPSHLFKGLDKVATGVPAQLLLANMFPLTVELLQDKNSPELAL